VPPAARVVQLWWDMSLRSDIAGLLDSSIPLDYDAWARVHEWLADHRLDLLRALHSVDPPPRSAERQARLIRVFLRLAIETHQLRIHEAGDELELGK
jgi:hypothetical protein